MSPRSHRGGAGAAALSWKQKTETEGKHTFHHEICIIGRPRFRKARFVSSFDLELPEIDGFPVDTCKILFNTPTTTTPTTTTETTTPTTTTETTTTTPTTTTETTTTTPRTMELVVTTKKPAVQEPPKEPETKNTRTPIRPRPAPAGPMTDSLLDYLLANGRGRAAGPVPGFGGFDSQPMGGLPHGGYGATSDSDESGASAEKRAGRPDGNRRDSGSSSSEDSSDES
uniref:endochitinase A-like isoform X2 n=1 Tax=Gasterosteus aculeatus aculeatus TaxID=481459 RepID=UPI001A98B9A5|nr:endochitinase A-like isoform X2 [Gasterosteus aculeatus aculeatus]